MNLEANFVPHDGGHFCPELSSFVEALLDDTRQCLEIVEVMPGDRVNDIQVDLLIVVDRDVAKADCGLELRLQCRIDQSEVRQAVERFAHRGAGSSVVVRICVAISTQSCTVRVRFSVNMSCRS